MISIKGQSFKKDNVIYTMLSEPYTEKESLCDYYAIAEAEVYEGDKPVDTYIVIVGFMLDTSLTHGLNPTHIFIKNQISEQGNHIYPETIEV